MSSTNNTKESARNSRILLRAFKDIKTPKDLPSLTTTVEKELVRRQEAHTPRVRSHQNNNDHRPQREQLDNRNNYRNENRHIRSPDSRVSERKDLDRDSDMRRRPISFNSSSNTRVPERFLENRSERKTSLSFKRSNPHYENELRSPSQRRSHSDTTKIKEVIQSKGLSFTRSSKLVSNNKAPSLSPNDQDSSDAIRNGRPNTPFDQSSTSNHVRQQSQSQSRKESTPMKEKISFIRSSSKITTKIEQPTPSKNSPISPSSPHADNQKKTGSKQPIIKSASVFSRLGKNVSDPYPTRNRHPQKQNHATSPINSQSSTGLPSQTKMVGSGPMPIPVVNSTPFQSYNHYKPNYIKRIKCINFPGCDNSSCTYFHPTEKCENGNTCEGYKTRQCLFVHPIEEAMICRYDEACTLPDCMYIHKLRRYANLNPYSIIGVRCFLEEDCLGYDCQLYHPKQILPSHRLKKCSFAGKCFKVGCRLKHPNNKYPNGELRHVKRFDKAAEFYQSVMDVGDEEIELKDEGVGYYQSLMGVGVEFKLSELDEDLIKVM